jgi:hypothetical protein
MISQVRHASFSKDFCAFEDFLGVSSASLYRFKTSGLKGVMLIVRLVVWLIIELSQFV